VFWIITIVQDIAISAIIFKISKLKKNQKRIGKKYRHIFGSKCIYEKHTTESVQKRRDCKNFISCNIMEYVKTFLIGL